MHVLVPTEEIDRLRKQRIRVSVVERDVGRGPQHHEHAGAVDREGVEDRRLGLEVGEVVLLLQAWVLEELRWAGAVALEPFSRDRVRDDDLRRGPAAELVLEPGELVVERGRARNPEPPCRHRQLMRPMRERHVEVSPSPPATQCP